MVDLSLLTPFARKQWAKTKWEDYKVSPVFHAIKKSIKLYYKPQDKKFNEWLDKVTWKATIDKKVNYLLARKPTSTGRQEELDSLSALLRETVTQYLLRGSLIWIVQGNGIDIDPKPAIMNNTIAVYQDENKEEPVAFIRQRTDIEVEPNTGAEEEIEYLECYYSVIEKDKDSAEDVIVNKRDTYCYTLPEKDIIGEIINEPLFIEIGKTGDAPLFAFVEKILKAQDKLFKYEDRTVEANTEPLTEVRGYTGSSQDDLVYAIQNLGIAMTDGNGGVTIHQRALDGNSIELWRKALVQKYLEGTCSVGKDNELQYAQSGVAMDRLFVDMENDARRTANILEEALKAYFAYIFNDEKVEIIWNTDKPVNDSGIIQAIASSRGLVSDKTLLEQHPWVDDVEEEIRRLSEQDADGFNDLLDNKNQTPPTNTGNGSGGFNA